MTTEEADRDRAFRIAGALLARTKQGIQTWSPTPSRTESWDTDLPSGNIEIGTRDNDGAAPYDLRIYGPSPEYGLKITIDSNMDHDDAEVLEELWRVVGRASSGVDETLDGLLHDLEGQ